MPMPAPKTDKSLEFRDDATVAALVAACESTEKAVSIMTPSANTAKAFRRTRKRDTAHLSPVPTTASTSF